MINNANEGVLKALIPVVDDFERAMQSIDQTNDVAALKEGVSLIYNKLFKTLEGKGLKPMVSKGEASMLICMSLLRNSRLPART